MFHFCSHCLNSARQKCIFRLPLNDAAFNAPAVNSVGAFLIVTPLDIANLKTTQGQLSTLFDR
jgi:hypothetical protein